MVTAATSKESRKLLVVSGSKSVSDLDLIASYLRDIGRVPLLSHNEEITLGRQVQELMQLESLQSELESNQETNQQNLIALAEKAGLTLMQVKRKLKNGRRAKERMVAANLRLVVSVAKKYTKRNMELMDLIQEGTIGLVRGVEKFDPSRGYKFSTYAYWWIRQGITRAIAEKSRTIRLPIHVTEMMNKLKKGQRELSQHLARTPSIKELAAYVQLSEDEVKDLFSNARHPLSLEMHVGDGEETVLLDLLVTDENIPSNKVEFDCMKRDIQEILNQIPEMQEKVVRMRFGIDGEDPMSLTAIGRRLDISRDRVRTLLRDALNSLRKRSDPFQPYLVC